MTRDHRRRQLDRDLASAVSGRTDAEKTDAAERRRTLMEDDGLLRHWADLFVFTARRAWTGALICALLLGALAVLGWKAVSAEPEHTATITVQGEDTTTGIRQQTVDEVTGGEPIPSWRQLDVLVLPEYLDDGQQDAALGDYDIIMSTKPDDLPAHLGYAKDEAGFLMTEQVEDALDHDRRTPDVFAAQLEGRYLSDLARGMGPTAVVNVVRDLADHGYTGPPRNLLTWFAWGIVPLIGLLVCGAAALRFGARERSVKRGLQRAQAALARTMLQEQALSLAEASVADRSRRARVRAGRRRLHAYLDRAARQERTLQRRVDRLGERLPIPRMSADTIAQDNRDHVHTRSWRQLAVEVEELIAETERLNVQTEAVIVSSGVLAGTAGTQRALDRILGPTATALLRLKARLRDAPAETVAGKTLAALDDAHADLLALAQDEDLAAGTGRWSAAGTRRWSAAEDRLTAVLRDVAGQLRRYPVPPRARDEEPPEPEEAAARRELRAGLGLRSDAGLRDALADADHAARTLLGPRFATLDARPDPDDEARRQRAVRAVVGKEAAPPRRLLAGTTAVSAAGLGVRGWTVALLLAWLFASVVADDVYERYGRTDLGLQVQQQALRDVRIDGPGDGVEPERVKEILGEDFPGEMEVVVAVRKAEEYLEPQPVGPGEDLDGEVDPAAAQEGVRRIMGEIDGIGSGAGGELRPGVMVVPVYVWEDGTQQVGSALTTLEGPRSVQGTANLTRMRTVEEPDEISRLVADEARKAGDELADIPVRATESFDVGGEVLTKRLLTCGILAGAAALLMVLDALTGRAAGLRWLGGMGRAGRRLRRVMRRVEKLMLGLDRSRIDAVAVLGAGPAGSVEEAGQRLYERELVAAWREGQMLAETSVPERARGGFTARVARLERTVAVLEARGEGVAGRAGGAVGRGEGVAGRREDVAGRAEEVLERSLRHAAV
ncbi:hypothetical protein HMPREF2863_00830 [Micrococcus sp. HMSC067E09]|uniref:hypothetical protein n=1 Tax=Micrococcus sp. HMSC067E09 TaxID=1739367 RepID=UPI0008A549A2|nr:hypothetical protein [Micrococcus sp. HMSC067E09]OFR88156.1 hypothetical protein HMPREF2863_00830 [Micrococcus sp. HMSC067E09]